MTDAPERPRSDGRIRILLVEDNPGDARLLDEALDAVDREVELRTIAHGADAIDFVADAGSGTSSFVPDVAFVDLDLPGPDGCEVLKAIRDDPQLHRLPVIMLTGSDDSDDVTRCYDANANAYLTKPDDPDEYAGVVEAIEGFWFDRARLPPIPA